MLDLRTNADALLTPFIDARGQFRTSPAAHGLEAFFAAVLIRAR
jgi:hypothetical protein